MSMPMTMIEVDQKTATILRTLQEKAMGLTLDALLTPLTEEAPSPVQPPRNEAMLAALRYDVCK